MGSSVSQITYWTGTKSTHDTANNAGEGGPGATYLSYDIYLGLAVLGGILALDHLYLRSPLTFLAKLIVNVLCFGIWWLYDASHAIFNKDVVKVFGIGTPGLGPRGIGAGSLAKDVPDKKHLRFFIYSLSLLFGGMLGIDSFVVGDKQSGIIRLVSLITIIFSFVAIIWWLYNMFRFFFMTQDVTDTYWEYFGAPPPQPITSKIMEMFPFLNILLTPFRLIKGVFATIGSMMEAFTMNPRGALEKLAEGPAGVVVGPLAATAQLALKTVDDTALVGQKGLNLAKSVVDAGKEVAATVGSVSGEFGKLGELIQGTKDMAQTVTDASIKDAAASLTQTGGGEEASNVVSYALLGTLGAVAVSGFVVTYRRSKKNGQQPRKDDTPPESGRV